MTDAEKLEELRECYEIVLKIARRAVRDLGHAIDNIPAYLRDDFCGRHAHYELVLGGTTDYRISLHQEIDHLEAKIRALTGHAALMARFPDSSDPKDAPF